MPFQQGLAPSQIVSLRPNSQLLLTAKTLWVDSVNGNDANPGTQALPFQTLARALTILRFYGRIYATFAIKLVGAGPYSTTGISTALSFYQVGSPGTIFIQGDTTADTVHATGTITGPAVAGVYPTTAGLGSDTQFGRFLRVTSGPNAGFEAQILENTDTSITFVTNSSIPTLTNETFNIISPGTAIGALSLINFANTGSETSPRFLFHRITFTGSLTFTNCSIGMATCKQINAGSSVTLSGGSLNCGSLLATTLGLPASGTTNSGLTLESTSQLTMTNGAKLFGRLVESTQAAGGNLVGTGCYVELNGARLIRALTVSDQGIVNFAGVNPSQGFFRFERSLTARDGGQIRIGGTANNNYGLFKFALTLANNDCIRATRGGEVYERLGQTTDPSGGSSGLGSYGHNAAGGGRIYIFGGTPALTGVGGQLHTTATTALNTVLNAANTSVDAVASPLGDLLVRVGT